MTRVLFVDDELINHQLVTHALQPLGFQISFAQNGTSGIAQARTLKPDILITDVMMPDINGYEVTRQLRRDPQFAGTPVLVLTAQSGLQDKLKAFEAGADDYLSKPFEAAELAARVTALLRRAESSQASRLTQPATDTARMIAVHSLRGGTGCSTLSVNLGMSLASLWGGTILLDMTMTAGQVALMLNMNLRRTWADVARFSAGEFDMDALNSVISAHESGLDFIAAPTFPADGESLQTETLLMALSLLKDRYDYIVADLPHDFSDLAIQTLDSADMILMVATPDMASVRATAAALDTFSKLGYPREKIKLLINATFPRSGLPKDKIEGALGLTAIVTIPHIQDIFVEAINLGHPPVFYKPQESVSALLEDFAFFISKESDKKSKPDNPSEAWKRVYNRYQKRKK
ncbi:MAG: response regulator [Anaerolineales bacterium]|nr:response regulator [Anaerolineales bacterium]